MARSDAAIADTVRKFLDPLDTEGIRAEAAYIYDSFAAGRANRWSDMDIAVVPLTFLKIGFKSVSVL